MRPVLFWTVGESLIPAKLEDLGWRLHPTADPLRASSSAGAEQFCVGLAAFDPAVTPLPAIQDVVLATHAMEWIALIPRNSVVMHNVMRGIADTFFDYHTLPPDYERLAVCLGHAYGVAELRHASDSDDMAARGAFSMVGRSPQMQSLYRAIRRINGTDAPVLIIGETGTGKELVARALHEVSSRREAPYMAVNCAALPENLIQAELFGHEKGAFTDARERRIGRIEAAEGGTLFLDEIGDLPLPAQAMMLRFLQERSIERLGGKDSIHVNVRVVAATHVDLEKRVRENRFREDLYYRLNVLRLDVAPLRQREGDVELLARFFLEQYMDRARQRIRGFSKTALNRMNAHDWPGNVRELINRVQRAVVICEDRLITPGHLGLDRRTLSRGVRKLEDSREQAEQHVIRDALIRNHTITLASAELGISRMTLYRRMAKYGLKHKANSV